MKVVFQSRRASVGLIAILCLTWLGWSKGMDVGMAIAGVAASLCASNSYEGSKKGVTP